MKKQLIDYTYNDGGRQDSGFKGTTGDCSVRAIAIACEMPYKEAYNLVNEVAKSERSSKKRSSKSNARTGVYKATFRRIIEETLRWKWIPTMKIGSGCKVHLRTDELPMGRIICNVSKHYVAVIDGIINDTHDCSRNGTRCVYGYWVSL